MLDQDVHRSPPYEETSAYLNFKVSIPENENDRVKTLRETGLLYTDELEPVLDVYTQLVKRIYDVPIALVTLVDVERQWIKAKLGLDVSYTTRDLAFCSYTILPESPEVFTVCDTHSDERFRYHPMVTDAPFIRYYAGAAIIVNSFKIGTLCVIDTKIRPDITDIKLENLKDIGETLSTLLSEKRQARLTLFEQKQQLVLNVIHNLRTPLTSAMMAHNLLEKDCVSITHSLETTYGHESPRIISNLKDSMEEIKLGLNQVQDIVDSSLVVNEIIFQKRRESSRSNSRSASGKGLHTSNNTTTNTININANHMVDSTTITNNHSYSTSTKSNSNNLLNNNYTTISQNIPCSNQLLFTCITEKSSSLSSSSHIHAHIPNQPLTSVPLPMTISPPISGVTARTPLITGRSLPIPLQSERLTMTSPPLSPSKQLITNLNLSSIQYNSYPEFYEMIHNITRNFRLSRDSHSHHIHSRISNIYENIRYRTDMNNLYNIITTTLSELATLYTDFDVKLEYKKSLTQPTFESDPMQIMNDASNTRKCTEENGHLHLVIKVFYRHHHFTMSSNNNILSDSSSSFSSSSQPPIPSSSLYTQYPNQDQSHSTHHPPPPPLSSSSSSSSSSILSNLSNMNHIISHPSTARTTTNATTTNTTIGNTTQKPMFTHDYYTDPMHTVRLPLSTSSSMSLPTDVYTERHNYDNLIMKLEYSLMDMPGDFRFYITHESGSRGEFHATIPCMKEIPLTQSTSLQSHPMYDYLMSTSLHGLDKSNHSQNGRGMGSSSDIVTDQITRANTVDTDKDGLAILSKYSLLYNSDDDENDEGNKNDDNKNNDDTYYPLTQAHLRHFLNSQVNNTSMTTTTTSGTVSTPTHSNIQVPNNRQRPKFGKNRSKDMSSTDEEDATTIADTIITQPTTPVIHHPYPISLLNVRENSMNHPPNELLTILERSSSNNTSQSLSKTTRPLQALIIDDSLLIRKSMKRYLESKNAIVDLAENGAVGLERLQNKHYDLVLLDFLMPIMSGMEMLKNYQEWKQYQRQLRHQLQELTKIDIIPSIQPPLPSHTSLHSSSNKSKKNVEERVKTGQESSQMKRTKSIISTKSTSGNTDVEKSKYSLTPPGSEVYTNTWTDTRIPVTAQSNQSEIEKSNSKYSLTPPVSDVQTGQWAETSINLTTRSGDIVSSRSDVSSSVQPSTCTSHSAESVFSPFSIYSPSIKRHPREYPKSVINESDSDSNREDDRPKLMTSAPNKVDTKIIIEPTISPTESLKKNDSPHSVYTDEDTTLIVGMSATACHYDQAYATSLGMHLFSVKPVNHLWLDHIVDSYSPLYKSTKEWLYEINTPTTL